MIQALRILRERNDVLALTAILLAIQFFPKTPAPGIYGLGVVAGAAIAVQAIGIVLIYRSNRIINFSQIAFGSVAGTLFVTLVKYQALIRLAQSVCPPCIGTPSAGVQRINYYVSLVLSLAFAVLLAYVVYTFVVKRFAEAPRLVLTVATIFLAQALAGLQGIIPARLTTEIQQERTLTLDPIGAPFTWKITSLKPTTFEAADILLLAFAVLAVGGILLYFRRSSTGVAIRAAAENPSRVGTLGISVDRVTSRVWIVAGLLSGVAGILSAMASGAQSSASISAETMIKILAVAVIARMTSLPVTAIAAVVFGILEQAVLWAYGNLVVLNGAFLFIIAFILLLQRYKASRAEIEQASSWKADREIRPTPRILRELPAVRKWYRSLRVVGVLALLGLPWVFTPSQTNLAAVIFIYAMIGMSLLVLTGWAGQISLGQFAFAAIGGYVAAIWRLPFPLPLFTAAIAGAVTAVVVGLPALKLRGLHLAITTLAFAVSVTSLLLNPRYLGKGLPDVLEKPNVLGMNLDDQRIFYYFTLVILALIITAVVGMRRSRTARALIAARDNEPAAQSFGINLVRARLGAFAVSGFIAAMAGAMYAYSQNGVKATAYAPEQSLQMFLMAVIGGFGAVSGPLIGAMYLGVLTIVATNPVIQFVATGVGGLAVLLFVPGGLGQLVFSIRDSALRRVAIRNRIVVPSLLADVRIEGMLKHRAAIAPKMRPGGGAVFVPSRYRLEEQWALDLPDDAVLHANARIAAQQAEEAKNAPVTEQAAPNV